MDRNDPRALLVALRDLLASAQGLVNHLLVLHGGPETIVPPPPVERLALPPAAMRLPARAAPKARRRKRRR